MPKLLGVWFPAVRAGTGADMFTVRLADALNRRGIRAEITWLPHRAEYAPWTVAVPDPPIWANLAHINSWLHERFIPTNLSLVVTLHSCVHDPALEPYKGWLQRLYHRNWIKAREAKNLCRADAVTAVSRYTANRAVTVFGCDDITPIYNWIDTECFQPDDRQTPNTPFRLLFVGKMCKLKGVDLMPAIMRQLGGDFELRYTGMTRELGNSADLPSNMKALGKLTTIATLVKAYQSCDALLFPTRLEGFGLVALEAQACGRPVIATCGSSLPEVVEHGSTGMLCPTDDIDAFVMAAKKLREDPCHWRQMCVNAVKRAFNHFSEQNIIGEYLALYDKALLLRKSQRLDF